MLTPVSVACYLLWYCHWCQSPVIRPGSSWQWLLINTQNDPIRWISCWEGASVH